MEFKYLNGQNRRTTSPPPLPISDVAYISRCPLRGCEFAPGGSSSNVLVPKVFPTSVSINAEETFQRELEKEEIRREIIADDMALTRRQELEEEVRREMASKRAFGISTQRSEGISFNNNNVFGGSQFHLPSHSQVNNRQAFTQINKNKVILARPNVGHCCGKHKAVIEGISFNNKNVFGGSHFHLPSHFQVDNGKAFTQINKDKVILLARPNGHCVGKRKVVTPAVEDSESLQKKVKHEWSCELCQITATSEKGLNDHIQGKKHKAKASMRTQKIGLDSRPECHTLHPCLTAAHIGKLESKEEDQDVHKSKDLVGLDNQIETTTSKEAGETNAH